MSNLVNHAKRELKAAGLYDEDSDYGGMLAKGVESLIRSFSRQGHSGFSAGMTITLFEKLARFEPLGPLTGEPDEWNEVADGVLQNKRCSHVFFENGKAHDIDGIVFRDEDGSTYTGKDSFVDITFPYTPTTRYVNVYPRTIKGIFKRFRSHLPYI